MAGIRESSEQDVVAARRTSAHLAESPRNPDIVIVDLEARSCEIIRGGVENVRGGISRIFHEHGFDGAWNAVDSL